MGILTLVPPSQKREVPSQDLVALPSIGAVPFRVGGSVPPKLSQVACMDIVLAVLGKTIHKQSAAITDTA